MGRGVLRQPHEAKHAFLHGLLGECSANSKLV
jgi:hypothetical protein